MKTTFDLLAISVLHPLTTAASELQSPGGAGVKKMGAAAATVDVVPCQRLEGGNNEKHRRALPLSQSLW